MRLLAHSLSPCPLVCSRGAGLRPARRVPAAQPSMQRRCLGLHLMDIVSAGVASRRLSGSVSHARCPPRSAMQTDSRAALHGRLEARQVGQSAAELLSLLSHHGLMLGPELTCRPPLGRNFPTRGRLLEFAHISHLAAFAISMSAHLDGWSLLAHLSVQLNACLRWFWQLRLGLSKMCCLDRFLQLEQANFALISASLAPSTTLIDQ